MNGNGLTITIKRASLLTTLREKRQSLETEWDSEIARLTSARDNIPKAAAAIADWYVAIGSMIAAGEARTNARGEVIATNPDVKDVPERPPATSNRDEKAHLANQVEQAMLARQHSLASLDAAIKLLDLADNDELSVAVSEYENLLATRVVIDRYGYHYR